MRAPPPPAAAAPTGIAGVTETSCPAAAATATEIAAINGKFY